jgi:hypothetical protein
MELEDIFVGRKADQRLEPARENVGDYEVCGVRPESGMNCSSFHGHGLITDMAWNFLPPCPTMREGAFPLLWGSPVSPVSWPGYSETRL